MAAPRYAIETGTANLVATEANFISYIFELRRSSKIYSLLDTHTRNRDKTAFYTRQKHKIDAKKYSPRDGKFLLYHFTPANKNTKLTLQEITNPNQDFPLVFNLD